MPEIEEFLSDEVDVDENKNSNLEKIMKILVVILIFSLIATVSLGVYSLISFEPANPIIAETAETYNYIEAERWYLFSNNKNNDDTAIIFYPKTKIDEQAYFYFANMLQRRGYDIFIVKSYFHQPSLSLSIIDRVKAEYPKYQEWYLGGHGSGSDVISRYLVGNKASTIKGAFYLGTVPNEKVRSLNIPLFIALGNKDTVFDWEAYNNQGKQLMENTELQIIEGGNQTNFGYYELELEDSEATISPKEQQDIVANRLDKFIHRNNQSI